MKKTSILIGFIHIFADTVAIQDAPHLLQKTWRKWLIQYNYLPNTIGVRSYRGFTSGLALGTPLGPPNQEISSGPCRACDRTKNGRNPSSSRRKSPWKTGEIHGGLNGKRENHGSFTWNFNGPMDKSSKSIRIFHVWFPLWVARKMARKRWKNRGIEVGRSFWPTADEIFTLMTPLDFSKLAGVGVQSAKSEAILSILYLIVNSPFWICLVRSTSWMMNCKLLLTPWSPEFLAPCFHSPLPRWRTPAIFTASDELVEETQWTSLATTWRNLGNSSSEDALLSSTRFGVYCPKKKTQYVWHEIHHYYHI